MANLIGKETFSNNIHKTQVYLATHDGVGNSLPYMNRSFISFTYGGKAIEDFGLIVINNGDRMEKKVYAEFSDITATYETLDGQIYWGSNFSANHLDLTLATDSITERQIDDFNEWFAPGKEKELILAERPNRAILARVASVPTFSILPFEEKVTVKIANIPYETSTTLYKGEVQLSFVMDEPYWYTKLNYMPSYVDKITLKELEEDSTNINKIATISDIDMIKIMYEDGIPHQSILSGDMFLGGNILVTSEARVGSALVGQAYLGTITSSSKGLSLLNGTPRYLFYSGTAPCKPTIQFSMMPKFSADYYISNPRNKIANKNLSEFSQIIVGDKIFKFTTPSILTGYNQAIQIFSSAKDKYPASVITEIREYVNEKYSRAWAIVCLNALSASKVIDDTDINTLKTNMKKFINANDTERPMTFSFNSKTGEAKGTFYVKQLKNTSEDIDEVSFYPVEENVGDMIVSDYLIIEGRNYINSDGEISLQDCKKIESNEDLTDVLIFFENMYL